MGETADEVLAKAEQVKQANAQDIQNWVAPKLAEIRSMLSLAGYAGSLTEQQYKQFTSDFKTHFAEEAIKGNPLLTEGKRKNKLRDWVMRNAQNPLAGKAKQPQNFGGTNDPLAVNQKWRPGETGIVAPNTNFEFIDGELVATPLDTSAPVQGAW